MPIKHYQDLLQHPGSESNLEFKIEIYMVLVDMLYPIAHAVGYNNEIFYCHR